MGREPVARVEFLGGIMRPVFEDMDGRQWVTDDDGERVYGVWFIPRDDTDTPLVVLGAASAEPLDLWEFSNRIRHANGPGVIV